MILIKIHNSGASRLISICDSDLIGKKFEQGNKQLDITERFYKGEEMSEEKIFSLLETCSSLNVVGKESIQFALKNKIIHKDLIIIIQGIPHAQAL
ncbi:MAG TPA: DUF424 family protein [Candidatus Nanoarchaeia archaeon]|nr:DUF424 family protein [Candidatus Nanoarchaeia archaeon]